MECNMNMDAEILLRLHQNEIRKEMKRIRLQEEALKGKTFLDKCLALLRMWMVAVGKELHPHYPNAMQESFHTTCREN